MIRRFNIVALLVACLALSSCFSMPASKGGDIYQIKPLAMAHKKTDSTKSAIVLAVTTPRVPAGYDRDRIALALDGGRRLDYYRGARWPAALPATLHNVFTQSLRNALPHLTIDSEEALGARATHRLDIEVIDFTPVYTDIEKPPLVQVTLRFVLTTLKDGKMATEVTLAAQQTVPQNRMGSVTAALESGLHLVLSNALPRLNL